MGKKKKLFSREVVEKHIIYRVFGIKFSVRNPNFVDKFKIETENAVKIQDNYDLTPLKLAKKLILFLTPSQLKICGGVMSIYSLCEASRSLMTESLCILSTYPNDGYTYANNDRFLNNEQIYRFSQIVDNCKNLEELIIHIPEYYSKRFYKHLKRKDIRFLKSIKNLQLNILNQNIELMPEPKKIANLYKLTKNITQTIAHDRYATQEVCDKWQIPTHLFSVNIDMSKYKSYTFEEKDKIIVLSPDKHDMKKSIVEKIECAFPDWEIITVSEMSFTQYMNLIGRGYFTVTFGEGMDGYFNQPLYVGGLGFAVYNDNFFPNESWKNLKNVYSSYEEMSEKICDDLKELSTNKDLYYQTIQEHMQKINEIYRVRNYVSNIERFYKKEYDFVPHYKAKRRL